MLRAFITVIDARGFTRAAEELGRSQPAVSLQLKRLEELLETPVFDRSSRLNLTRAGAICEKYGRKIIALHDEMVDSVLRERGGSEAIRLGIPSELAPILAPSLAFFSQRENGGANVEFICETSEALLDRLRSRQLDVAVAVTGEGGADDAVKRWRMPMSWISGPQYRLPASGPLPLITTPEGSLYYDLAAAALQRAGRKYEIVCKTANIEMLKAAVDSGLGVSAFMRGLAPKGAQVLEAAEIAGLPDVTLGLYAHADSATPARPLMARMIDWLNALPAVGEG